MEEINRVCIFNILHVCDYVGGYDNLTPYIDYPGHIVNCPLQLAGKPIGARQAADLFGRPFMGGMERKGIIASGNKEQIRQAVLEVLKDAPERFILGADCTVPSEVNWDKLRTAIKAAHEFIL